MNGSGRYVVLGLAPVRGTWFTEVARWSTTGSAPVEFVKCIAAEELRARVVSGRPLSALLVDSATGAVDRDLADLARRHDIPLVVIDSATSGPTRDWLELGAAAALRTPFGRDQLVAVLEAHARPIDHAVDLPVTDHPDVRTLDTAPLVAVTGPGGTGASTIAMALAQGWAHRTTPGRGLVLADLRLRAELALLHDARDTVPGIQELVEAHRSHRPDPRSVRSLTFRVEPRQYHLLLGLRRPRDWAALRPRALGAALDGLQQSFEAVVADVEPEVDGEATTGSVEVEERNAFAREAMARASLVLVVGHAGVKGLASLALTVARLAEHGIDGRRLLPVINRAGRRPRARAEITQTWGRLGTAPADSPMPVFVPERRGLEACNHDGAPLPASVVQPVTGAVMALLPTLTAPHLAEPQAVAVGSLGHAVQDHP